MKDRPETAGTLSEPNSENSLVGRRSHISHACKRCRRAKVRCDGRQPCAACQQSSSICTYTTRDKRLKENRLPADYAAHLQGQTMLLSHIWEAVQRGEENDILHDIRAGVSINDALRSFIKDDPSILSQSGHSSQRQIGTDQVPEPQSQGSSNTEQPDKTIYLPPRLRQGFGNLPFSSAILANRFSHEHQQAQMIAMRQPEWKTLPLWTCDDSFLGRVYTDFSKIPLQRSSQTLYLENNVSLVNTTLLLRDRNHNDPYTPDSWASQVLRTFTGQVPMTTQLATVYGFATLMRWLTDPSPDTYAAMPSFIRPTMGQRMVPHPSSIDLVSIARFRDVLMTKMRDFVSPLTEAGVSVNWPRTVQEALIEMRSTYEDGSEGHEYFISPAFVAHISDQKNWSFGRRILQDFPELAQSGLNFTEDEKVMDVDRYF